MSVLDQFLIEKIVPEILDEAPKQLLKVYYPSGVFVNGSELKPVQVKNQPNVEWEAGEDFFYTLLMADPDAPTPFKEVRHWLVVNIQGKNISSGDTICEYIGSGPPKGIGTHRYIFLVFKQLNGKQVFDLPFASKYSREGRLSTKTRKLIADYTLQLIAGNFYSAQYDDYVPLLYEQMGGPPTST